MRSRLYFVLKVHAGPLKARRSSTTWLFAAVFAFNVDRESLSLERAYATCMICIKLSCTVNENVFANKIDVTLQLLSVQICKLMCGDDWRSQSHWTFWSQYQFCFEWLHPCIEPLVDNYFCPFCLHDIMFRIAHLSWATRSRVVYSRTLDEMSLHKDLILDR